MEDPIIWQIVLQFILIALNAIFACAEIAVISMNDNRLSQLASQGDKRALRLVKLTDEPARFLATIQVAITLSGFLGSAFAADNFSDKLVSWLVSLGLKIPVATIDTISVIVITLILSYFTLVFGELVPKRVAMKKAEALALGMSSLITFISKIFAPIVWTLTASTNIMLRLFGIDPNSEEEEVSEEEIRMLLDVGSKKGVIHIDEKEIIQNVFEFDDLTVGEFATHRTEIDVLWKEDGIEKWEEIIHESRHSLYPVCEDTIDNVVGVLNAKDYFRIKNKTVEEIINKAVKPAYFVPEGIKADVLFRQMKKTRNHFAVVLDEYGGVMGIVTMSDLLEQLVGDLDDDISLEDEKEEIQQIDEHTWEIQGCASLDEVAEILGINLPLEEFETFGGYVFSSYGSVPDDGTQFEIDLDNIHVKVVEIKEHRIEKTIVVITESDELRNLSMGSEAGMKIS